MVEIIVVLLWLIFCFLSLGVSGLNFVSMRRAAAKPWQLKIDKNYTPKVSILVPTYNESSVIRFKLENLSILDYPTNLLQIIVVDSNSSDSTVDIVKSYAQQHPELDISVLSECKREGKSAALNSALDHAQGELLVVSDADCFYPSDILRRCVPYMSNSKVSAISGPKLLLNSQSSKAVKNEKNYLESMNLAKLGESKMGFTPLFEGGFSAYKRAELHSFDPYKTGSDDCGTVIKLAESSHRALFVSEAAFFTAFPVTFKERLRIKIRRANQLIRVFRKYLNLSLTGRIKFARRVILSNIMIYLFCPLCFVLFLFLTAFTFALFPYLALLLILLLIPRVGPMLIEVCQSYLILFFSAIAVSLNKNFIVWKQPEDRQLLTQEILKEHHLI